ncbi:F0F1 ATP synthase subunit epsilon [Helcobacillus massiliensis]|uniref:F-type H+-transporting ATPase subunit epsilon n=1 Tax=Helcobacillus massiliensis TaxID=521392 RepID=A0A839QQS3_9MICO|nr:MULTISPECIES: F0F1 ATP synthase subunit epsilon [Helcobacillus]MBB3022125.1 F-type H+-transporting ATPase subunit epsilon [Helcobacillus massiliensis]MCG7426809.1 F0F1 ATP synthase subunit epsilon [Helcobacillus sp. ACRRO]MCT1557349.1 F0F1 ATP synthase subunit epsilon [Helcobacillus massiliensis]MCT2037107.1 F0F1 ATP synthase subunit epsilon [Helcobacillus massiliensis]MCT2331634.1 F0F1 ATP synthase subunit epsilon [Helcobacillus massiliensis]
MSASMLSVTFVTAHQTVWEGEASYVRVPAADGSMGLLPNMAPVLAALQPGIVEITRADGSQFAMQVTGGFVSVDHSTVKVVVDEANELTAA